MRLATLRRQDGTRAGVVADGGVELLDARDVGEVLTRGGLAACERTGEVETAPQYAPLVLAPSKIVCVGLNYRAHIVETGREIPQYPTLFTKFADSLVGADDEVLLPAESHKVDWEAELALVVGRSVRRAGEAEAEAAIAGFAVANDVSMRDWQQRTLMWDQGKFWDRCTPLGPCLVSPDELPGGTRPDLAIECLVNDQVRQSSRTGDLVFDPVDLVRYVSTITTLRPGDVILTGTPGGVGMAMDPPTFLAPGDVVTTRIEQLGESRVRCVRDE